MRLRLAFALIFARPATLAVKCGGRQLSSKAVVADRIDPALKRTDSECMSGAALSAIILGFALVLFLSDRVRHDLVALLALLACIATGLVAPGEALRGFAAPAVITVAAVLVVGRAVELSGAAAAISRRLIPEAAPFQIQLGLVMVIGAVLSAFMNNIAALVLTMPIATQIARRFNQPNALVLMPLAFATILGGMTTLIGTPANLILSNIREDELGSPFSFFAMAPVGAAVTIAGLVYLTIIGWRLIPANRTSKAAAVEPWQVFELGVPPEMSGAAPAELSTKLRSAKARLLALIRDNDSWPVDAIEELEVDDRLLVLSRADARTVASKAELKPAFQPSAARDAVFAHVIVANGSPLIGHNYASVGEWSDGGACVVAAGPRAARVRLPLARMIVQPGDQLFVNGSSAALGQLVKQARLLELNRLDDAPVPIWRASAIVAIYAAAIAASILFTIPLAIGFLSAAVAMIALRLLPGDEAYRSIDWSIVVLLAAMIPVGRSFDDSGAAAMVAQWLGATLAGAPLFVVLAALCFATLLLSIFLNNVATAVVMGPIGIGLAQLLGVSVDAALLAVLIGASSDFLTPIGHHNNTLVMSAGGYRFSDYARVGAPMVVIVVLLTAATLTAGYG